MRYKSFRIRNFKGIKDTTINFGGIAAPSVFAFVGLNESGKTTVLEGMHSFSPDSATSELLSDDLETGLPYKDRVPRHLISSFTGDVSVAATLLPTEVEKQTLIESLATEHDLEINSDTFPSEIILERHQRYENGDFKRAYLSICSPIEVRSKKKKKWRAPDTEEHMLIRDKIFEYSPIIAYFPTFVFDFPEAAFLTDRGTVVDRFYRRVFQDILDYDGLGQTIEKDIVRRVRGEGMVLPWLNFLRQWGLHDDEAKIQHVMDRASQAVTKLVFGRWNKIFGEDTRDKEVVISHGIVEGEKQDERGNRTPTNEHDVYIKFQIKDGTRRFNVNDRSLGFRWFFAFMLFTQFRVARASSRPIFFLFDEPASNLHAAAQQKLIESFPEIAQGEHALAYSTHSHYMIEPKWLEQTFIVTNRSDAPPNSILDQISLDDESLDIKVATYRAFVNANPGKTSYFQPILDRLQVVPSRFDIHKRSIVLEGKSDYYILRYAAKVLGDSELPLLPALGAGTFGALAALHIGWGLHCLFVLDGDKKGKTEKERYTAEFGVPVERVVTIDELVSGVREIEGLLDHEALGAVQKELHLIKRPNKDQIRRFFQEKLASDKVQSLGPGFASKAQSLLEALRARMVL